MSLHYLIDGYNVVKSVTAFSNKPLSDGRDAFITWLKTDRPQGSMNNRVTVVFDGRGDVFGQAIQGDVEVIFTHGTSADDRIRSIVEKYPRIKDVVVVSNDKDITIYARALGAAIVSVERFTVGLNRTIRSSQALSKKAKHHKQQPVKNISHVKAAAINKELRKLWINDD